LDITIKRHIIGQEVVTRSTIRWGGSRQWSVFQQLGRRSAQRSISSATTSDAVRSARRLLPDQKRDRAGDAQSFTGSRSSPAGHGWDCDQLQRRALLWLGRPALRAITTDAIASRRLGGASTAPIENHYEGDWPQSWAGWWPPAGAAYADYGFQAFEGKYFLSPTRPVGGHYRIYAKDPAHPDGFINSMDDRDGVRKRITVAEQSANLASTFSGFCLQARLAAEDISCAALSGDSILGYGVMRQTRPAAASSRCSCHAFDVAEIDWQPGRQARRLGRHDPGRRLAAAPGSEPVDRLVEIASRTSTPTRLTLTYEDKAATTTSPARTRSRGPAGRGPHGIESPLVMTATMAKRTAEMALAMFQLPAGAEFTAGLRYTNTRDRRRHVAGKTCGSPPSPGATAWSR
jgi:hypothetical protein